MEQSKGGLSVAMIISIIGWLVCAALAGIGPYVKAMTFRWPLVVTVIMLAIGIVGYVAGIAKRNPKTSSEMAYVRVLRRVHDGRRACLCCHAFLLGGGYLSY